MKKTAIFQELFIWIRGRFSLTGEEKLWLLVFLVICWTGLLGRYVCLENQSAETLTQQQLEELLHP